MDFLRKVLVLFCLKFVSCGNDFSGTTSAPSELYFSDMPETIQIDYIDAETLIKFDNKGERVMGVSDEHCDNGRVNIETDFDPHDPGELKKHTTCDENQTWTTDSSLNSVLTIMTLPERYVPIHKCMHVRSSLLDYLKSRLFTSSRF